MPRTIEIRDDGFWWKNDSSNCYMEVSEAKYDSLGQIMKLKDLLDLWWNSVRVRVHGVNNPKLYTEIVAYKTESGKYCFDEMIIDESTYTDILNMIVKVDDEYTEDGDWFPIVYATAKNNKEE